MPGAGDMNDPAWVYVTQALKIGQDFARGKGYAWKGDSCFVVATLALRAVILTRQGEVITEGPRAGQARALAAECARQGSGGAP